MRNDIRPGDLWWMSLEAGTGREQKGRRPVLILSDARLTALGLALVVPMSTTDRGWPTHVRVVSGKTASFAMCEQIRSVSIERLTSRLGETDIETLREVRTTVRDLVGM